MTELQLQAKCYQWAHNTCPQLRGLLFHVPNGGTRHAREAMSLKASGVVPGIPDVLFLWNGKLHAFEFKAGKNGLSPDQRHIISRWTEHGVITHVIRDFETFQSLIKNIIS